MLRKSKLALVALIAAAPFALAVSASAKPIIIDPGFGNGPKYPKPYPFPKPWPKPHWHPQYRPVIVVEQPVVRQVVQQPVVSNVARAVSQPAPRKADCLTKEYTQDGMVVFKDLCTKETASAALPGSPAAQQTQQQVAPQGSTPGNAQSATPAIQSQMLNTTNAPQASAQVSAQPTAKN